MSVEAFAVDDDEEEKEEEEEDDDDDDDEDDNDEDKGGAGGELINGVGIERNRFGKNKAENRFGMMVPLSIKLDAACIII
jgi:hypothetical protein